MEIPASMSGFRFLMPCASCGLLAWTVALVRMRCWLAGSLSTSTSCLYVGSARRKNGSRSEEHTSELQSLRHLVCRLLLEKKKKRRYSIACDQIQMSIG